MADLSLDLRRRIADAYVTGRTSTYVATASMFSVGTATVNRILRRKRETGDVIPKPKGGNNPRRVDLGWLRKRAIEFPDARIVDRMAAWKAHSGKSSSLGAMWNALRVIGWSHKKTTPVARERDRPEVQAKRRAFLRRQPKLDVRRLIFLDESGFRLGSVAGATPFSK